MVSPKYYRLIKLTDKGHDAKMVLVGTLGSLLEGGQRVEAIDRRMSEP